MDPADTTVTDQQLLRRYVETDAQDAFAELVRRHVNWINSMAARLTHDRAMADDVTQAVFLLLARKAGSLKQQDVLSTWLFTVTRYASSTALRKEIRRKTHERKAAAMHEQAVESSAPQWQEMSPLLDQLVARLRAADRQAVLLRFYEQKSFVEIGRALQISEEAARKRVNRSIETLRGMFARQGVTVGAVALAATMSAHLTQPASAAVIAGSSAVSASTASSALVHATGVMLTWASVKPIAAAIVVVLTLTTVAAVTLLQTAPIPQSAAAPTSAPTTAPQPQVRYGRVVTQDDVPVVGARIWQIDSSPPLYRYHVIASTTADGEGRFQFPITGDETQLVLRAEGFAWAGGMLRSTAPDDPDDIRVVAATSLRVKLVGPDGKAAAGVPVRLVDVMMPFRRIWTIFPDDLQEPGIVQTSNADGICIFNDLPQGGKGYVNVEDERFSRRDDRYDNGIELAYADHTDGPAMQLKSVTSISGNVSFADGKPAANVRVYARNPDGNENGSAWTDDHGRYEIKRLTAAPYAVMVELNEELNRSYAAKVLEHLYLRPPMSLEHQDFTLVAGGTIRGRITERESGRPIPNIPVEIQGPSAPEYDNMALQAKSDADGMYVIHVAAGKQHVGMYMPSSPAFVLTRPSSYDVSVDDGQTVDLNFQLARGNAAPVTGRVVDAAGHPVSGAEIHVQSPSYAGAGRIATATDAMGNFSIAIAEAGSQLRARKGKMTTLNPIAASGQNLTLVLHRNAQGSIHVVIEDQDGKPIAGARLELTETLGNDTYDERLTGPDGSCLFRGVDPDMVYRVKPWATGFGTAELNVQVQPGKQTDVPPIRLRRADSSVGGIVLDETGNPLADIKVTLMTRYWGSEARTDIAGRFKFKGLVAGERVQFMAENNDHSLSGETRNVTAPADDAIITVQPTAASTKP